MKKLIFILVFAVSSTVIYAQTNYQDVVYLKNGSIVRGIITEQIPNESLKIETADGNAFIFQMSDVEKITKEKIAETETKQQTNAVVEDDIYFVDYLQDEQKVANIDLKKPKTTAINIGVMMGGGSLIGLDFEFMPVQRFGIQAGVGISSFGFGLNYHFQNRINSSFISAVYWQQGWGDNHYASYVGPMFTFRLKKILQAGIGYGIIVKKGPAIYKTDYSEGMFALLFNLGVYFPL